jgi:hypothetical protein
MKRFLVGTAVLALVMIFSATSARAERGRRGGHSYVTYSYAPTATYYVPTTYAVPATYAVPTYIAPAVVAPTYVAPTYVAPVVATSYVQTIHQSGRRRGR